MQCSSADIGTYFEMLDIIGTGASGTAYRAAVLPAARIELPEFGTGGIAEQVELVAIKVGDTGMSHQEISIMKKVDSPWTMRYYGCFTSQARSYVVMELCQGVSLAKKLQSPMRPEEKNQILLELAQALKALQNVNIVHRDIKPENIMLCPNLKLIDYGLSSTTNGVDHFHEIAGSPKFMDPQHVMRKMAHLADLWSYGQLAYYIYTGDLLWEGKVQRVPKVTEYKAFDEAKVEAGGASKAMVKLLKSLTNPNQHPKRRPDIDGIISTLEALEAPGAPG
jgi:serine/threonine protein kinase